jgi:hypothetical protein
MCTAPMIIYDINMDMSLRLIAGDSDENEYSSVMKQTRNMHENRSKYGSIYHGK